MVPDELRQYGCFMASIAVAHPPWSAAAWRDTVFVASGVALQAAGWLILGASWTVWTPVDVTPVLVLAYASIVLLLRALRPLTSWQRERCWAMLGLDILRMPDLDDGRPWDPLRNLRSPDLWRVLQYHLVVGPLLAIGGLIVIMMWAAGAVLAASGLYVGAA